MPELLPIFLTVALGFPLGLGGLMILAIDLLTEQGPAISLAYEKMESSVMDRPPRDLQRDRLVSASLLRYSYLIAGKQSRNLLALPACGSNVRSIICVILI